MVGTSFQNRLGFAPEEAVKSPCVVVATTNITLLGLQTINSVVLAAGDRVLITAQTNTTEHGIYNVAVSNWTRSTDWNDAQDVINGQLASVPGGIYQASFTGSYIPDTTVVTFAQIFGTATAVTTWQSQFVATGAITLSAAQHGIVKLTLHAQSGGTDDLDNINGGVDGDILFLKSDLTIAITVRSNVGGNIANANNNNYILNNNEGCLILIYSSINDKWLSENGLSTA